jgi:hypothetical protein
VIKIISRDYSEYDKGYVPLIDDDLGKGISSTRYQEKPDNSLKRYVPSVRYCERLRAVPEDFVPTSIQYQYEGEGEGGYCNCFGSGSDILAIMTLTDEEKEKIKSIEGKEVKFIARTRY